MPDLDAISDQTYATAGADFAFVLTRRGRLLSRHAPQEMPQEGRSRIVEASLALAAGARFGHLELAREDLVPYGGAAPVEVYFGLAADHLLCVVIPTWAARDDVFPALEAGVRALDELAREEQRPARKQPKRSPSRPRMEAVPPSGRRSVVPPEAIREPPPPSRPEAVPPPGRKRSAVAGLAALASGGPARSLARPAAQAAPIAPAKPASRPPPSPSSSPPPLPSRSPSPPPLPSPSPSRPPKPPPLPRRPAPPDVSLLEIRIGEATLGRESLAAIDQELGIPRASLPDVRVGSAPVGRETLVAIEAEVREGARPGSAPEALRVELASISRESLADIAAAEARQAAAGPRPSMPLIRPERMTRPWVEPAEDAKRAADAAARARNLAPPELDVEVIDADTDVFDAALADRVRDGMKKP